MSRYPAYTAYKDSGVEWLGQIPAEWEVKRLKNIATYNDESLPETTEPDYEMEYVDISSVNLVEGIMSRETITFEKAPSRARRKVRDGDTIVSTVRTYLKAISAIKDPPSNMIVSTGFAVVRPKPGLDPDYIGYLLQSEGFIGDVVAYSVGVSYPAINGSDLARLPVVEPSLSEQQAIARFLDEKTAQIDRLIAKKEALLAKLVEKRTVLISQAVTKGLDPTAPMKDSRIPWLGQIPAHWKILPLKYAVMFQRGHDLPTDKRIEGNVPLISSAGLLMRIDEAKAKAPGIVTGRYGTIGKFTYVEEDYWPLNTTLYSIKTYDNNVRFLYLMLHNISDLFILNSQKSAVPGVDRNDLHPVLTALPPICEQNRIVEVVSGLMLNIDQQTKKIQQAIITLQEYRTAIITNAVTGKIDVRQQVAQTPQ